jgi:hypothetical protein
MKKFFLIAGALAALLIPSVASADVHDQGGPLSVTEAITGKFSEVGTVSYVSTRSDELAYVVNDAPTNGDKFTLATLTLHGAPYTSPWSLEMKISAPLFTATDGLNHGQYVSAAGGGKDAAQACAGMPTNSKKGGKS